MSVLLLLWALRARRLRSAVAHPRLGCGLFLQMPPVDQVDRVDRGAPVSRLVELRVGRLVRVRAAVGAEKLAGLV